jgi:hypothetical protein
MQFIPFTPSRVGGVVPFQFSPTIDGETMDAIVTWNAAGQRWYVTLVNSSGDVIFHMALAGAPLGQTIETLEWQSGHALGTTVVPFSFRIGNTYDLAIYDCAPNGYNGRHRVLMTGPNSFSYALPVDPGLLTNAGSITFDLDMLAGYGFNSTMVYRSPTSMFEINP